MGDRAVSLPDAGAVFVAFGNTVLQVQVVIAGAPQPPAVVVAVARKALARLG